MKSRAETSKAVEAVAKKLQSKPVASLSPALSKLKSQLEAAVCCSTYSSIANNCLRADFIVDLCSGRCNAMWNKPML